MPWVMNRWDFQVRKPPLWARETAGKPGGSFFDPKDMWAELNYVEPLLPLEGSPISLTLYFVFFGIWRGLICLCESRIQLHFTHDHFSPAAMCRSPALAPGLTNYDRLAPATCSLPQVNPHVSSFIYAKGGVLHSLRNHFGFDLQWPGGNALSVLGRPGVGYDRLGTVLFGRSPDLTGWFWLILCPVQPLVDLTSWMVEYELNGQMVSKSAIVDSYFYFPVGTFCSSTTVEVEECVIFPDFVIWGHPP